MRYPTAALEIAAFPLTGMFLICCGGTGTPSSLSSNGGASAASNVAGSPGSVANAPGVELGLPPPVTGAVRYQTTPITVPPGQDVMWSEWIAPPLDDDRDVISISGAQSKGGHHALLVTTTDLQPVGTSRQWLEADQLTMRTLGAIGAEGGNVFELPPGVVTRAKKGGELMIQSHFINTSDQPISGYSVIDVALGPVDPNAQVASLLNNTTLQVSLPPSARSTVTASCFLPSDYHALMYANHMHQHGVSVSTELVNPDGSTLMLKDDPSWNYSWAFDPNFTRFPLQSPQLFPAGSTIKTTCTYANDTSATIKFPDEMCVFTSHILNEADVDCIEGQIL
jgi:hypothetical protein